VLAERVVPSAHTDFEPLPLLPELLVLPPPAFALPPLPPPLLLSLPESDPWSWPGWAVAGPAGAVRASAAALSTAVSRRVM
jgi:hypothetical protein